ncbi:MAG: tetratricopeptide repeat protein [Candidatus Rokubacteria bacterium]|nr:tetratricopeptide repeat protein [Candidatus Rokubacteria bacterium]
MRWLAAALAVLCAGCAAWPPFRDEARVHLGRAEALVERGDYTAALEAYDELLRRHPDGPAAARARATRSVITGLLAARDEVTRLEHAVVSDRNEIERLEQELARNESEVARLAGELADREREISRARHALAGARQEVVARQAEMARLAAEADRLRGAIADLKRLELDLERRR